METTSATSSATSALLTSLGAGSGIDMAGLASNLAVAQFAGRTDRLTARAEVLDRQISLASNLKGMMLNLASSLGERVRVGDLSPQPQLANSAVASAALSGTSQPTGSYSVEVTALATSQTLASPAFAAASTPVGAGTLTLRFGTIGAGGFAEDTAHPAASITIPSGASLADTAAAINASGSGVSAYIANTTTGAKLVLKGKEGAANAFIVEVAETLGEEGLAALAWNGASDPARVLGSAANAALTIDGLPVTAIGNTVSDAIPGVTLSLKSTNIGTPTQLSFADPKAAISSAMQDLTAALNEIAGELRSATNPLGGDLARDNGARALRQAFGSLAGAIVMPSAANGAPRTLADLGLSTQRDGSYVLDTKRLDATLKANPAATAAMFTNGLHGIYATVDGMARRAARASDPGTLAGSISRYTSQKTRVSTETATLAEKQEALRAQLVQRFARTDNRVGASRSTLSFLQNQIDAWNSQGN